MGWDKGIAGDPARTQTQTQLELKLELANGVKVKAKSPRRTCIINSVHKFKTLSCRKCGAGNSMKL